MEQWDIIYKKSAPRLIGICRRYVKDNQQAEDLMHTAFITAISKVDTYSNKGSFDGWLNKIAINTALLHLRGNKNSIILTKDSVEDYSEIEVESKYSEETQRKVIENADFTKEQILEVIDQLPGHHRMVFNLYVMDGYTHKQIGNMLNISSGTSKSHLARARKKIQQLLFEKTKDKNKKRSLFILFFLPKQNYIDKLYNDSFVSFEIQPKKNLQLENGSQFVNTQQTFSLLTKIISNKILLISCIGVISASILSIFFLIQPKVSAQKKEIIEIKPVNIKKQIIVDTSANRITTVIDSNNLMQTEKKTIQPASSDKKLEETERINKKEENKIIVIHKTIIQRDTVIKKVQVKYDK